MKENILHVKIRSFEEDVIDFSFLENKTILISREIIDLNEFFPNTKNHYLSSHYQIDKKNIIFYLVDQKPFETDEIETFLSVFDHFVWVRFLRPFCIAINNKDVKSIVIKCVAGQPNYLKLHIDLVTQLILQKTVFFKSTDSIQFLFLGHT